MFGWFKRKKEPKPVPHTYRIAPSNVPGKFYVEEYTAYYSTWGWFTAEAYAGSAIKVAPVLLSELDAERWIEAQLDARQRVKEDMIRADMFKAANPPREVPPFRVLFRGPPE